MSPTSSRPRLERRHLGPDPDNDELVSAIVDAVEGVHNDPEPFDEPLYETVDTEALAQLMCHADGTTEPAVSFVAGGCTVAVSPGLVVARPADDAGIHRDPQAIVAELTAD